MKVLWVGDAVISSGFSRCTHAACDALHQRGHSVTVLGINHWGDPHSYPYPVFPCYAPHDHSLDLFGEQRLPRMIDRLNPDVVVLLNDPWNVQGYLTSIDRYNEQRVKHGMDPLRVPPIVAWLAVDAKNQSSAPQLNALHSVAVWTDFARTELAARGCTVPISVVPLGVDTSIFYPRDRREARERAGIKPEDADKFIVGVVGRNQYRKRLDLTLSYFHSWIAEYKIDDALLYLHVAPTGDHGCDLRSLVRYYGLSGKVILAEPEVGYGVASDSLAHTYSAFDVYLSTSAAEGWCLPALEAMACGVPCILPDAAGFGWARGKSAGVMVPCDSPMLIAPMNRNPYTVGAVPSRSEVMTALDCIYASPAHRDTHIHRGLKLAASLSWENSGAGMATLLEGVHADCSREAAGGATVDTAAGIE